MTDLIAAAAKARPTVLVVLGSARAGRLCPAIASWVVAIASVRADLNYELADLAEWTLPMDDEPAIPAGGRGYARTHTRAWSDKVASADAVMFVTPQYNGGYPAALKNALDHLYREWNDKPAVIVSYGGHGGSRCAAQLRQVLESLKMRPVATMPALKLTDEAIRGGPLDPWTDFQAHADEVRQAVAELAVQLAAAVT